MDRKSSYQNTKRSDERIYRYNYDSRRDYRPKRNSSPVRKQHNAVNSFSSYVPGKYRKKSEERDYRPTLRPRKRSGSSESSRYHRPIRQEFNRHTSFKYEIQRKERTACLLVISRIREETLKKLIEIIPGLTNFECVLDTSKKREYHVEFANEFLTAYAFSKLNGILLDGCGRIDMQYLPRSDEERFQTKENANIGAEIAKDMISRHPELYMDNKPPRSAKYNDGLAMSRPNHFTNDSSFSRPSSLIYVDQNKPIASEQSYDRKNHEIKPSVVQSDQNFQDENSQSLHSRRSFSNNTDQETKEKEPIIKDIKLVVIEMRSRDEINESLLSRIMAQFNNLVEAKLDDDRKSSRAVFSSDFDALLAVNCLNGAIIANTIFTARLVADTTQLIPKTAGAEINCVTNRSVNEDKVNQLSDSEVYLKEANYEYDDTSYDTEDEQSSQEEEDLEEEEEDDDDEEEEEGEGEEESDDLEYEWVSNKEDDSEESDVSEKDELDENNGNNGSSSDDEDKSVNQETNEPEIKVKRKSIDIDIDSIKTPKQVAASGIEISRKKIKNDD